MVQPPYEDLLPVRKMPSEINDDSLGIAAALWKAQAPEEEFKNLLDADHGL